LQDLILLDFTDTLALLLADLDAGNTLAALDAGSDFLLAASHKLVLFGGVAGKAAASYCHRQRDGALRTAQLGVFRVLDVGLTTETLSQVSTRFSLFFVIPRLIGRPWRGFLRRGCCGLASLLAIGRSRRS
jgi:hypothetical protein